MIDSLIIALQDFGPALAREGGSIMQISGASGSRGNYVWGCRERKRDREREESDKGSARERERDEESALRVCVRKRRRE